MVLSTSVAFTFYLGQQLNNRQTPQIIVYHYENGTYPWGIRIKENWDKAYVENEADTLAENL